MSSSPSPTPRARSGAPATVRMARWSATHPWRAIGLWLVFVAACISIGNLAGLRQMGSLDDTVGQSGTAAHWVHDAGLEAPNTETVLITSRAGPLDLAAAQRAATPPRRGCTPIPAVSTVAPLRVAPDRSAVAVPVSVPDDNASVTPLLDATAAVQQAYPGLRVEEVGSLSVNQAVNQQVADDLSAAATFSLPVTLLIMLIAFGAILAAGVPILLALSAVGAATGLSALVSHVCARLRQHLLDDPADGHGGRRRLLAVLHQAGARRTAPAGPRRRPDRRHRDRRAYLRALGVGLRPGRDRLDDGPLPGRRPGVRLAGHRLDPRGRHRRARFADGAARRCWPSSAGTSTGRGCRCCGAGPCRDAGPTRAAVVAGPAAPGAQPSRPRR